MIKPPNRNKLVMRFINGSWFLTRWDKVQIIVAPSSLPVGTKLVGYTSIPLAMRAYKDLRSIGGIFV